MLQKFQRTLVNLLEVMILLFLYLVKPFKFIKLMRIHDGRIGHLAYNTELFLRRLQLNILRKEGILYIGIASTKPANKQLLKMYKRKLPIIQVPFIKTITSPIIPDANDAPKKSVLARSAFYQEIPMNSNEYHEFSHGKPSLHFTEHEEEKGEKLLNKMGIDSWFVCFHSRDATYLSKREDKLAKSEESKDRNCHGHRNSDVKNYLKTAEYIASCGGYAVRMGYDVAEKLPDLNNPRIIDYASYYRSDFGDIYLVARCKFFLGTPSGIHAVSLIFNIPAACANVTPLEYPPVREGDLFIPKKIWSIEKKRVLTFGEILESGVERYNGNQYRKAGLIPVENTAEEILDLAKEMNERLDGNLEYTEEDEELQKRFHSLFQPHHLCYGAPARIGTKFLQQNKELLDEEGRKSNYKKNYKLFRL